MTIEVIAKVLIPLLGAVITYILIPYFKAKTTAEQRDEIYFWVQMAVQAAEMVYRERGQGALKKEYVVGFLTDRGIRLTLEELDVLIEAAVKELNLVQGK